MYSEISSVQDIERIVKFDENGFNQTQLLGSFINNNEYSNGFVNFMMNRQTADAYMWKCISAIGDQLGEITYTNIRRYIDFVSNVDTCKVQSLRSMMRMLGFDYTLFDNINQIPVEILNLMNIVSISKKYLFNAGFLNQKFVSDLFKSTGHGGILSSENDLSSYFSADMIANGNTYIDYRQISDIEYFQYITDLYKTLISGFLTLEYNVDPDHNLSDRFYIYKTVKQNLSVDELFQIDIKNFKIKSNISLAYDQAAEVNKIENDEVCLSDYSYPYSELLQMEIDYRNAKATSIVREMISGDVSYSQLSCLTSNTSKYTYYRRKKVDEYIDFVNNKYFIDHIASLSSIIYKLDPDFLNIKSFTLDSNGMQKYIDVIDNGEINDEMVEHVSKSLAVATMYIIRLREKLKLQSRKNYMKGTANLLLYIINEYLIDYSRHHLYLSSDQIVGNPHILKIMQELSSHSLDHESLNIIEYFDETEYYNQKTNTSVSALNDNVVIQDFWKQYNLTSDDGLAYGLREIQKFYLSSMMMKDVLSSEDDLSDFLDTIFEIGAHDSFIDKKTGIFTTKLSRYNEIYSNEIYTHLSALSTANNEFKNYIQPGYQYPLDIIRNQITNILDESIFPALSDDYFKDISVIYDTFHSNVIDLSIQFENILTAYNQMVYEDNQFYLTSSDVEYCIDSLTDPLNPVYKHDFYIDNPVYMQGVEYLSEKLSRFKDFIYSIGVDVENHGRNIQNHQLIDMAVELGKKIQDISSSYTSQVVYQIQDVIGDSGFVDVEAPYMEDELRYGYDYLTRRQNTRLDFLNNILNEIRNQASTLQEKYNAIEGMFSTIVSQYDDQNAYYQLGSESIRSFSQHKVEDGGWQRSTTPMTKKGINQYFVKELGMYYYQVESGKGDYGSTLNTVSPVYDKSGTLINRIDALIAYMNMPTSYTADKKIYGLASEGSIAGLEQCKIQYAELTGEIATVAARIKVIGGNYKYSDYINFSVKEQIDKLIDFLTQFDEKIFENDSILANSKSLLKIVTSLSSDFTQVKIAYQDFMKIQAQRDYLQDFTAGNQLTIAELNRMLKYQQTTDEKNRKKIIAQYETLYNSLYELQADIYKFSEVISKNLINNQYSYMGVAELDLVSLENALFADIENRFYLQNIKLENEKNKIYGYINIISSEISDKIETFDEFDSAISAKLCLLNFFDDPQYIEQKEMFQEYTSLSGIGRYPYYNQLNITHPSYQIHPFLWNFVIRDKYNMNSITKSFYSIAVNELEDTNIRNNLYKYYGEFGNSVNSWLHNTLDYSGYTTGYENSQHYSMRTSAKSEIVGYDGIFFPPAVEMIRLNYEVCLQSLSDCADINSISAQMFLDLSGNFYDYISYDNVFDESGIRIGVKCTGFEKLVDFISIHLNKYLIDKINYSDFISEYIQSNTSTDGILNQTISMLGLIRFITSKIPETFYGRFYRHIGFEKDSVYHRFIIDQLIEYYPEIMEMTKIRQSKSDIYDIYKYCVDANGNQYMLVKVYHDENPTYKQKQNTLGRLWIRPCEFPFAFPAFTGQHPCMLTNPASKTHLWINNLAGRNDDVDGFIYDPMECFYDLDMPQNKNNLYLVSMIKDIPNGFTSNDSFVQNYQNPWILNIPITNLESNTHQFITKNTIVDTDKSDNAINSGESVYSNPKLSSVPAVSVDNYAYIGLYQNTLNKVNFVYAKKRYTSDRKIILLGDIKIIPVENGQIQNRYIINFHLNTADAVSDEIVFSYDQDNILTFAYLVKNNYGIAYNGKSDGYVDLSGNTIDSPYGDPRQQEMTSHDIFGENIRFVKYRVTGISGAKLIMNTETDANINADMSYIPVYPGLSGEADLVHAGQDDGYIRIELLGKSKNIDYGIVATNISVDPYFDYNRISSDYVFGRVYEDFDVKYDKSLRFFSNPSINDNSNKKTVDIYPDCFVWKLLEISSIGYTDHDRSNLKFAFYNVKTLGKNPYMIASFKDISDGLWHEISGYEKTYEASRFAETVLSGIPNMSDRAFINITGTYSDQNQQNFTDCNHIENISGMFIRLNPLNSVIEFKFTLEDPKLSSSTFIEYEMLKFVIYNLNDMRSFNHYHYMDVYGAVNMRDTTLDIPKDIIRDDVSFIYDRNAYKQFNMSQALMSYYEKKNGIREYTSNIDLSEYDYLSDVYILNTSKRLNFMYDEENVFKFGVLCYYFPTFNTAYPKTIGQGFENSLIDMFGVNSLKQMFSNDNLFIIDLLPYREIADQIGGMDVPIEVDDPDCYRVFENETVFEDGLNPISSICDSYDPEDSRAIAYMHVFEEDGAHLKNTEIEEIFSNANTTDEAADLLDLIGCSIKSSQAVFNTDIREKIYFEMNSEKADISKLLKLYVNYKKASDGIHLYFNYFNYLNTPFIEIRNNKIYPVILPNSYLHLSPGQSGSISFITQFKYIIENGIYGCKNIELAKYNVFNVSDDKPKFVLKLSKTVSNGDGSSTNGAPDVKIQLGNVLLNTVELDGDANPEFFVTVNVTTSGCQLKPGYSFGFSFMPELIRPLTNQKIKNIDIDTTESDAGYVKFTINDPTITIFRFKMYSPKTNYELATYAGKYLMEIELPDRILGMNNMEAVIQAIPGNIIIN